MPDDDQQPTIGYADAVDEYWRQGWRGILPLRRGRKIAPPAGFTGSTGQDPSYPDVMSWAELYPDGNLCLRMPADVIGIDVDAYGAKTGAATLAEAERRWGALPPTTLTTSRDDGVSGIRLYRIPAGVEVVEGIEFPELGIGDIETVQRHHRYALAWPSIHPEGRGYWWRNSGGQIIGIPAVQDLPELPAAWLEALRAASPRHHGCEGSYPATEALTAGEPSTAVVERLRQAIKELNLPGSSRHDTARGHVLALMRLGKRGEPGVEPALRALGEMFIALVTPDRAGGRGEAEREYRSFVVGPGAGRELARPSNTDWTANIVAGVAAAVATEPEQVSESGPDPAPYHHIEDIERGFWDQRDSLKAVYTTALSRMCSPWAVLAHTLARALTQIPPHIMLPPVIGGPGSLNWFAAVAAASGGGKGSAAACARGLIPSHVEARNLGSGEGIIAAYGHQGDPTSTDAIMFTADEVDAMTAMGNRQGSTTMSVLRSAFSGEGLGFSYVNKDKRYRLPAHGYRFTLVLSVQPERADALLGDAAGGTPQRFMWFPGTDHRITADVPWEAGPLALPRLTEWLYPRTLKIPALAEKFIREQRVKAMRGETDALDGHAIFCREKAAFALAVIDGRTEMSEDDWALSGVLADVSAWTRSTVADAMQSAADRIAEERGRSIGVANEVADFERAHRRGERVGRVLRWVLKQLDEAGDAGLTKRDLSRKITSRDRSMLDSALLIAVDDDLVKHVEGKWLKR